MLHTIYIQSVLERHEHCLCFFGQLYARTALIIFKFGRLPTSSTNVEIEHFSLLTCKIKHFLSSMVMSACQLK